MGNHRMVRLWATSWRTSGFEHRSAGNTLGKDATGGAGVKREGSRTVQRTQRNCNAHREARAGMAPQSGAIMARPICNPAPTPPISHWKQALLEGV